MGPGQGASAQSRWEDLPSGKVGRDPIILEEVTEDYRDERRKLAGQG